MDSILTSVKLMLGIQEEYTYFDPVITTHINSVLMILTQLGVGPEGGYVISDDTALWTDFIPNATLTKLEAVKSYVHLKVRLLFDPPISSSALESTERLINELEWRLNVAAETPTS